MSYNPPYYNSPSASCSSAGSQQTRSSSTNSHLPSSHLGRVLPSNESHSVSSSYYHPPGANPSSQLPPPSHAYRTAQQYTSPPSYGHDAHYRMNYPQDYPSPPSPGHSRGHQSQAPSPYPSASTSRSVSSIDNQSQTSSRSHLQDEVHQLPTPPQTVYSPASPSVTSESDGTITDIASPPDFNGLLSLEKSVEYPSTLKPEEAAKFFDDVDVKEEEKEGCVTWTDPMGNVHWLRTLERSPTPTFLSPHADKPWFILPGPSFTRAERQQWSIVFECSDDAAPGISLIDARRGFGIKRDGMIPGVPVDWEEAVLRPYWPSYYPFVFRDSPFDHHEEYEHYTLPTMARLAVHVALEYEFLFWAINHISNFRLTHFPMLKIFNPGSRDPTGIRMDQLRLVRLNSRDGEIYFPEIVVVQT
ncbi:uncharacterized protein STEHIDRAFT_152414 [Stereum hirsutum FP-91666 SS1]|uniref:uncharacterized protein n=1 Tax=Stereum hirsutum (strain FP-91666) TaxID=721885 RepID=UPI000440C563|nr:uncharacterized protein STEHIDRAFT_152414 [Stereum hirsutum FP-91666 SS1]EIM90710.1 hypothetical protein STEHIDRAFT_152414 [Stereum hirsutum FP-91666 SS1]